MKLTIALVGVLIIVASLTGVAATRAVQQTINMIDLARGE